MHLDFWRLHVGLTVGQGLAAIRNAPRQHRIIYFYVVNDDERLLGVIPTRRLLLNDLDRPLAEIMVSEVIAIPQTATILETCEFFVMHRLLAFPIVDERRRIVGVVNVELYTDELEELDRSERNDNLFQLIGVHLAESQQASPLVAFRSRFPWLVANIAGGILAAFLSGMFEAELQQVVAFALFIPVVLALAESVSIQSVSLALQLLHGQRPTLRTLTQKLRREVLTGAPGGSQRRGDRAVAASGSAIGAWYCACCLALPAGVTCSAVIGVAMPNLFHLIQRNPRVAAGPVALAMSDMVTLVVYFNLARWALR